MHEQGRNSRHQRPEDCHKEEWPIPNGDDQALAWFEARLLQLAAQRCRGEANVVCGGFDAPVEVDNVAPITVQYRDD
jgi:hypothetical protein